jgi:Transglycosylase SLT domain
MLTAQALAACIFAAAQTYAVPPSVLLGILSVEGGRTGQAVVNTNGSYDLGPMQINTVWIPQLSRYWGVSQRVAVQMVRDDACVNIGVAAWIVRSKINSTGSLVQGIAHYHSATPKFGSTYSRKVIAAMQRYRQVRGPADLAYAPFRAKGEKG